jgi:hypothetical protein
VKSFKCNSGCEVIWVLYTLARHNLSILVLEVEFYSVGACELHWHKF